MQILRASDYERMPWKNGGGETVEIAVFPPHATVDDFDWRISMATVAMDGPFSLFPGIDRTLSILEGKGMSLAIDTAAPVLLTKSSAPLHFAADIPVNATLADGAITDLNVMTRRGRFLHRVERMSGDFLLEGPAESETVLLLSTESLSVETGGQAIKLDAWDAISISTGARVRSGNTACYAIYVSAV